MSEIELLGGGLWQWDTSRRVHVEVPGATYGGTWVMRPSQNGFIWERTA